MPDSLSNADLARIVPGTWTVAATNFPFWLSGKRVGPVLRYGLLSADPLTLSDVVEYSTETGEVKKIIGVDRVRHGEFVWRGRGLLRFLPSRWRVTGVDDESRVMALRYGKTVATPAGIDIVVRDGTDPSDARSIVAATAGRFGLSLEDFASLTWFRLA